MAQGTPGLTPIKKTKRARDLPNVPWITAEGAFDPTKFPIRSSPTGCARSSGQRRRLLAEDGECPVCGDRGFASAWPAAFSDCRGFRSTVTDYDRREWTPDTPQV